MTSSPLPPRAGLLVAALLVLGLFACPATQTGPGDSGEGLSQCEERSGCQDGQVCTPDGYCADCESSGQCRLKESCSAETRRCLLREGWGTDCATNEACPAGQWCRQGLCLDRTEVSLCPGGTNAECPTRSRCNRANGVCEEDLGCSETADCGPSEVCNTGSHACVPRCTVQTQGEVCQGGERCVADKCVQCERSDECGAGLLCDAAGRCAAGARCYSDRDCKVPLSCHLPTGACLSKLPPCVSDESCGQDERCDVASGRCVARGCQKDRFEPNDSAALAYGVKAQKYTELTLCEQDVDVFSIALSRGDQLGVNVDADAYSENSFRTVVQDAQGRTLSAGKLLTSYVAPAAATYFVALSTTDLYHPYDINFLVSRGTPCDDDGFEPNDTPSQATLLNAGTRLSGAICPQDVDHFLLVVPDGKGVKVSLADYSAGAGLLRLCLYDQTVELSCSEELLPSVSAEAAVAGGRSLVARVSGATARLSNSYTLVAEFP